MDHDLALIARSSAADAAWDYMRTLHPPHARGRPTLLARAHDESATSRTMPPAEAAAVVGAWIEMPAAYASLHRYHRRRRSDDLAALNALWLDLDTYRAPALRDVDRSDHPRLILDAVASAALPTPSFLVDSGRGIYTIWMIDELPPAALPRWRAAITALVELMAPLGADPACTDPARVLRVPGSRNEKAGRAVSVIGGDGRRRDFDVLADATYRALGRPTRTELKERQKEVTRPGSAREAPSRCVRGLPHRARWRLVREDLDRLLAHWGGRVPVGMRVIWLHLVTVARSHIAEPDGLADEVEALAAVVAPSLPTAEVRRVLRPTIERARMAAAGRRTATGADPRYGYAGARMAAMLGVDEALAEALDLEQVIPSALRVRRNARRRRERERVHALPRTVWLAAHCASRERPWEKEGVSRASWYRRRQSADMAAMEPPAEPSEAPGPALHDADPR